MSTRPWAASTPRRLRSQRPPPGRFLFLLPRAVKEQTKGALKGPGSKYFSQSTFPTRILAPLSRALGYRKLPRGSLRDYPISILIAPITEPCAVPGLARVMLPLMVPVVITFRVAAVIRRLISTVGRRGIIGWLVIPLIDAIAPAIDLALVTLIGAISVYRNTGSIAGDGCHGNGSQGAEKDVFDACVSLVAWHEADLAVCR